MDGAGGGNICGVGVVSVLKVTHDESAARMRTKEAARVVQQPNMGTLFITSFFLLGIIIFALYLRHNASSSDDNAGHALPPYGRFGGLFADHSETRSPADRAASDVEDALRRASLLARAASGERKTLMEAHASGDAKLYDEVLNALVLHASGSDATLLALVSDIARAEDLRVNRGLAEALMENWKRSPGRAATAKMLHMVALADDAALYERAVELALQYWREGRVQDLSAAELRTLADGEYWVLTSQTRGSGAGFLLKRTLSRLRRELEGAK